jgi:hypothetical protein
MSKNDKKNAPMTEEIVIEEAPAALATTNFGSHDDDFEGDADRLTADDVVIGRFKLVQAMSQGKRENGWQEGQIYDTSTKKAFDSLLIIPVVEDRVVVERLSVDRDGKKKGSFVREHSVDSPVVVAALARNSGKFGKELSTPEGNALEETRNIHFAILEEDLVTVRGFGILVATSTNLYPVKLWKTARSSFTRAGGKPGSKLPMYAYRTLVDGRGVHPKNETCLYRFAPPVNNNWKESAIDPDTCTQAELKLLYSLKEHAEMIRGGKVKVAEYGDADDSEEALEAEAF